MMPGQNGDMSQSAETFLKRLAQSAELDQASEHLKSLATRLGVYLKALMDEGFEREEALDFVHNFHNAVLEKSFCNRDD